ncbi:hypothetical protein Q7P37_008665 [Cladosporium fusiforme]
MASRIPSALRSAAFARPVTFAQQSSRSFQTSQRMLQDVAPVRKPVGAFRGTRGGFIAFAKKEEAGQLRRTDGIALGRRAAVQIFGFLLGSTISGSALYYYVVDEYKVSNELLSEDVYALQSAVQRLEGYVKGLEQEVKARK